MASASAELSASTTSSEGPASMSMPAMRPDTICFAAVTQALPGPQITSHAGTATPSASAAIACAPPAASTASAPATAAAAKVIGCGSGDATTTRSTPATRAGVTVISTDDGSG